MVDDLYVLLVLFCLIVFIMVVIDKEIDEFFDICIDFKYYKEKLGLESDFFNMMFYCILWKNYVCCMLNIIDSI